jgi:hypothetical protein
MGIKFKFPNFKTTARILKIDKISSFENPKTSSDFLVEQNFALSAEPSSKLESFNRSYLLMFLWSLSVSGGEEKC